MATGIRPVGIFTTERTANFEYESISFPGPSGPGTLRKDGADFVWQYANVGGDAPRHEIFMRALSADFLMEYAAGDWVLGSSYEDYVSGPYNTGGWRLEAEMSYSRLGGSRSLASIIERAMIAQGSDGSLISELEATYRQRVEVLAEWRREKFGEIEEGLERVRSRLLGARLPDAEPDA